MQDLSAHPPPADVDIMMAEVQTATSNKGETADVDEVGAKDERVESAPTGTVTPLHGKVLNADDTSNVATPCSGKTADESPHQLVEVRGFTAYSYPNSRWTVRYSYAYPSVCWNGWFVGDGRTTSNHAVVRRLFRLA